MDSVVAAAETQNDTSASSAFLSRQDVERLTNFKWRYSLEAHGFSSSQAARLLFVKWMYGQGKLQG